MRSGGLRRLLPLLHQARYEVLPTASAEQAVLEVVPREVTVTVTASPTKGLEPTLALTERLIGHGYRVVPHLSARQVRGGGHLAEIVPRLVTAGVDDVFVPAGDADPPSGEFTSALDLLEQLAELGSPFARVGITGYPETHPKIEDDVTVQAMWDKRGTRPTSSATSASTRRRCGTGSPGSGGAESRSPCCSGWRARSTGPG